MEYTVISMRTRQKHFFFEEIFPQTRIRIYATERGFTRFLNENISLYGVCAVKRTLCNLSQASGQNLMNFTKIKGMREEILLRASETLSSLVPREW